ncbi:MAG TPA: hypothetical protein DHV55_14125 [Clostridiaceae bacterium]|nr:hypothetical protein [Clostridiaceae bacterium]
MHFKLHMLVIELIINGGICNPFSSYLFLTFSACFCFNAIPIIFFAEEKSLRTIFIKSSTSNSIELFNILVNVLFDILLILAFSIAIPQKIKINSKLYSLICFFHNYTVILKMIEVLEGIENRAENDYFELKGKI